MSKFGPKYEQNTQKMAVFCYRRIGRNGRIFGTEYSAGFGRIFGRIFGIRSYTRKQAHNLFSVLNLLS